MSIKSIVSGVSSDEDTPDPIPNSAVKLVSADGSLLGKSRPAPGTMDWIAKTLRKQSFCVKIVNDQKGGKEMEPRNEFEERLDALRKKYENIVISPAGDIETEAQKAAVIYQEWVESRGRLILFLRDELAKVADFNEHLADTLEAVCAENEHLSRKLAGMEALAQDLYLKNIKMEAEHGFSVGQKISRKMLTELLREKTFF